MGLIELFILAVGLSMDAFAVSVCKGLAMERVTWRRAVVPGLWFGAFQGLMPLLGWLLGSRFAQYITAVDHWIAFALLVILGVNMLREARRADDGEADASLGVKTMLAMAVATSIDALAVGVTFAFLDTAILPAIGIIGCTTFCISVAGVAVGCWFGARYKKRAEITGGAILVLLGIKILLEHLGILAF